VLKYTHILSSCPTALPTTLGYEALLLSFKK
jgi:hypothetical protein